MQGCFKVIKNEAQITPNANSHIRLPECKEIDISEIEKKRQMQAQRQSI